jgi:Ni/Fe-hydrogenase subunit HybB-like protein
MPLYTCVPLLFELVPAFLEWVHETFPNYRAQIAIADKIVRRVFPYLLALAFLLPAMHQSSLGALMLLAGNQVNPLWQTPFLPLLYVWAAAYMGFAFVMAVLLVAHLVWKRTIDMDVLSEMSRITVWITAAWMAFRFVDLGLRGSLVLAFAFTLPAALFWMETALLLASILLLVRAVKEQSPKLVFVGSLIASLGGMLYRFDPTTLAFQPRPGSFYFPSAMELTINLGILSLGVAAFCVMVKLMAFLPASNEKFRAMEAAQTKAADTPLAKIKFALFASAD